MPERLSSQVWIDALRRRAELAGAGVFILHKGDPARGDVLVKVACLDGTARAYVPSFDPEGDGGCEDLARRGVSREEPEIDGYIARARARDPDLWVIEIEDRDGRHFLVEPVSDEPQ